MAGALSRGEVLRAEVLEGSEGVLRAELESVLFRAAHSSLEFGIFTSSDQTITINVLEGEDLVDNCEASSSALHLAGKTLECGVVSGISGGEVTVGSETVVEDVSHELSSEEVASNCDGGECDESVESSAHMDVDVVLSGGTSDICLTGVVVSSLGFCVIVILSDPGDELISNISYCESSDDITQGGDEEDG